MRNVYIVEDHPLMRHMLCTYVSKRPDLNVYGSADTAEAALDALSAAAEGEDLPVDLLLVDVSLPNMSGIDLIREAHARWSELTSVMVTGHGENAYIEQAQAAGAKGYVLKGKTEDIGRAIRHALDGESFVSEALLV